MFVLVLVDFPDQRRKHCGCAVSVGQDTLERLRAELLLRQRGERLVWNEEGLAVLLFIMTGWFLFTVLRAVDQQTAGGRFFSGLLLDEAQK